METQITKKNENFLAQADVRMGMYPTRDGKDYHTTRGQDSIIESYISLTTLNKKISLAEIAQEKAQHELGGLYSLRQKKVKEHESAVELEKQELQEKGKALDKARKHLELTQKREPTPTAMPVKLSTPKISKSNYGKDLLEIFCIDMLVLFSQWSVLRESLSVDQLIVRSALVLAISIFTLLVKRNFRKSGDVVHKIFYFVCMLMIISSVFSTVAVDAFHPVSQTLTFDDFTLSEVVVEQVSTSLLDKYRANPGLPELFVALTWGEYKGRIQTLVVWVVEIVRNSEF